MTVWQYLCKWECHVSCLLYESWLNFHAHLWQHNYPRFDTRLIHETCTMLLAWSPSHMERANKDLFLNGLPSKHESSTQCQCSSSTTLTQHWTSIGWMTRVCWVCRINGDWTQDAGLAAVTVRPMFFQCWPNIKTSTSRVRWGGPLYEHLNNTKEVIYITSLIILPLYDCDDRDIPCIITPGIG